MGLKTPLSAQHLLDSAQHQIPISLIRPMLNFPRSLIESYCTEHGLAYRTDESNMDTTYTRNRIRHEVIPLLTEINPNIRDSLGRLGMIVRADEDLLKMQTLKTWEEVSHTESAEAIRFHRERWRELHPGLQWRTLRRAIILFGGTEQDIGYRQLESALRTAQEGKTGASGMLPDELNLSVGYDEIIIHRAGRYPVDVDWPLLKPGREVEITQRGSYDLIGDWSFHLSLYEGPRSAEYLNKLFSDKWSALLNADSLKMPLYLRTRRPGDRFYPQGVGGRKKLKDFQIDQKIPARWRNHLPLLTTSDHAIIWVCGSRVDESFTLSESTSLVWLAQFVKRNN